MKRLALFLVLCFAGVVRGQQLPPTADSAVARALKLAEEKDSTVARRLLDSLATYGESPLVRGEATYQLSRLAATDAERERILGTLIIDQPFSPRLPAALVGLGMLELARNDRDRAATHLARYLSVTVPPDSGRLAVSLALGRLLLERGDLPRGCAALLVGRSELPETAVELRNQFEFSVGRCQGVDTTTKVEVRPVVDTTPAPRRTGAYTVQVAAYDTKSAAEALAKTLRGHGLEARVVGTSKPFRVRVGRYATRSDAEQASREVDKAAKSRSIVVIVGPEER
jgi:hypothetical protein